MAYTKVKPLMVASFPSSRLTGAFGAISGASLTGLGDGIDTKSASNDPAINTNPSVVGHTWLNKTSGEMFVCTDTTAGKNVWVNVGFHRKYHYQGDIKGVAAGGSNGGTNRIEEFSFASNAGGSDLGDLLQMYNYTGGFSSPTHGYIAGSDSAPAEGPNGFSGKINKFAFASSSNATLHATLDYRTGYNAGGINTPYDGYIAGGYNSIPNGANQGDRLITKKFSFASSNTTSNHASLLHGHLACGGASSETDGFINGGQASSAPTHPTNIEKFSFSSTNTATNHDDLGTTHYVTSTCSSQTHAHCMGGAIQGGSTTIS